jgi:hypothetical protein
MPTRMNLGHKLKKRYVMSLNFTFTEGHIHASFLAKVEEIYPHLCSLTEKYFPIIEYVSIQ